MCNLINKQLLFTAYAYLFAMEQQEGQQGSEALRVDKATKLVEQIGVFVGKELVEPALSEVFGPPHGELEKEEEQKQEGASEGEEQKQEAEGQKQGLEQIIEAEAEKPIGKIIEAEAEKPIGKIIEAEAEKPFKQPDAKKKAEAEKAKAEQFLRAITKLRKDKRGSGTVALKRLLNTLTPTPEAETALLELQKILANSDLTNEIPWAKVIEEERTKINTIKEEIKKAADRTQLVKLRRNPRFYQPLNNTDGPIALVDQAISKYVELERWIKNNGTEAFEPIKKVPSGERQQTGYLLDVWSSLFPTFGKQILQKDKRWAYELIFEEKKRRDDFDSIMAKKYPALKKTDIMMSNAKASAELRRLVGLKQDPLVSKMLYKTKALKKIDTRISERRSALKEK